MFRKGLSAAPASNHGPGVSDSMTDVEILTDQASLARTFAAQCLNPSIAALVVRYASDCEDTISDLLAARSIRPLH